MADPTEGAGTPTDADVADMIVRLRSKLTWLHTTFRPDQKDAALAQGLNLCDALDDAVRDLLDRAVAAEYNAEGYKRSAERVGVVADRLTNENAGLNLSLDHTRGLLREAREDAARLQAEAPRCPNVSTAFGYRCVRSANHDGDCAGAYSFTWLRAPAATEPGSEVSP